MLINKNKGRYPNGARRVRTIFAWRPRYTDQGLVWLEPIHVVEVWVARALGAGNYWAVAEVHRVKASRN